MGAILGYVGIFFLAAITRGVVNQNHGTNSIANVSWIIVAIVGIYFLGWWSLLAFALGSFTAGFIRTNNVDEN